MTTTTAEDLLSPSTMTTTTTMAARRGREIAFLARELFQQVQGVLGAVGDLVPAELASGAGELEGNPALRAVAERLDEALACFDLLQEELGLPLGREPRYRRLLAGGDGAET
jgi:hypothetical protein